jgi:hypothetical protein
MNFNQVSITKVCATNNENDQINQIKFTIEQCTKIFLKIKIKNP